MLRSRGAWLPTREKGQRSGWVTGGTVRSYPALVMPHPPGLRLLRQVFPQGTVRGLPSATGPALVQRQEGQLWRTGLKAAHDAPGRCSTVGGAVSSPGQVTPSFLTAPTPCAPISMHPDHCWEGQVLHVLQLWADKEPPKEVRAKFHVPNLVLRDGASGPRSFCRAPGQARVWYQHEHAYLERKQGLQGQGRAQTLHIQGNHLTTLLSPVGPHPALPTPARAREPGG